MKLAAVSDTHNQLYSVEPVDILVHAGDLTIAGSWKELEKAVEQLLEQPAEHRVVIAGNHDYCVAHENERARKLFKEAGILYLEDEEVIIKGLRIYGSPYTLEYGEYSFMLPRNGDAVEKWKQIPTGVDILVTHGPPWGRFDVPFGSSERIGCPDLTRELIRIKPKVHIFGHIHSPGDVTSEDGIRYINAAATSTAGGVYRRVYAPVMFELDPLRTILMESADYSGVYAAAKCSVVNCANGAWSVYKRLVKTETGSQLMYSSYCSVLDGHYASEEMSWVGGTRLYQRGG